MGSNFKEKSFMNIDPKEYEANHKKIFGERIKRDCKECDLSSRQKKVGKFRCPHCRAING